MSVLNEFIPVWKRYECFIAIEWPRDCEYWKRRDVIALSEQMQLLEAQFHGCYFGLMSIIEPDKFLKKPWKVRTNCKQLQHMLDGCVCPKNHEHAECRGKDCKISENYNEQIVKVIHKAWKKTCS